MKHKIKHQCAGCKRQTFIPVTLNLEYRDFAPKNITNKTINSVPNGIYSYFLRIFGKSMAKIRDRIMEEDKEVSYTDLTGMMGRELTDKINELEIPFQDVIYCLYEMVMRHEIYKPNQLINDITEHMQDKSIMNNLNEMFNKIIGDNDEDA